MRKVLIKYGFLYLVFLLTQQSWAQVEIQADTTHLRIGEQIRLSLITDKQRDVIFPKLELDSLRKLEVVHNLPIDTIKNKLYKKYILTSFDSGTYTLPRQKIFVGNQQYLTDSLLIEVGTVKVDTTQQKLFPIKPIYKAPPKTWRDFIYLVYILLGILVLGFAIWWLLFRNKKGIFEKKRAQLTPIEEALILLDKLDQKDWIQNQQIKEYYVDLTEIVRSYLGQSINIPTLEVTTDELITLLEIHNKSQKLGLEKEQIQRLQQFLKQADLVKFAKAKPENQQINEDRQTASHIIQEVEKTVHKPELDEEGNEIPVITEEEIQRKKNRKRRITALVIIAAILLLSLITASAVFGVKYVKDTLVGHPTKELLEGKWYQSSYGYPAVSIQSPKILKPITLTLPDNAKQLFTANATFNYGSLLSGFYVVINTIEMQPNIPFDEEAGIQMAIQNIQAIEGVKELDYKTEETEISGVSGTLLKGTYTYNDISMRFEQYIFNQGNTLQQIWFNAKADDTYAAEIISKMKQSIQIERVANEENNQNKTDE